ARKRPDGARTSRPRPSIRRRRSTPRARRCSGSARPRRPSTRRENPRARRAQRDRRARARGAAGSPRTTARPSSASSPDRSTDMSEGPALLSPETVERAREKALAILAGLDRTLLGQSELTRLVLVGCLARGHVLLEGLPGLGKTELVKGLAALLGLSFKRLQFTPDLLPGDITGGHILEEADGGKRRLVFPPGPVFSHVILADEINRASPKTQSALLEAMAERRVTVLGETHKLPDPFYVLATQNPIELEGTYPLPEAQLDRFLFKVEVPILASAPPQSIITERPAGRPPEHAAAIAASELREVFSAVDGVYLP